MAESKEELKYPLGEGERGKWESLKPNIKKTKILASGPITSWQTETLEAVTDICSGSKTPLRVTAAMKSKDASWQESDDKPRQCVKNSKDITLTPKICIVKAIVFPAVMQGYESWTVKKAERWRIDVFRVVLEKTLETPLDSKIKPEFNFLIQKFWIFIGRTDAEAEVKLMWRTDSLKTLKLGKTEGQRWRGRRMRGLDGISDSMDMSYKFEQILWESEGRKPGTA